ncbi:MAG TPA: hypothetical protein ENI19_03965 [Candidatus Nealsonbacteria bacterium]|uniref:Uncharacterized protein n=1 Tax=marine sediment metagenome TaxID=412755 RepID=A0A0F9UJW1_9ZZZZ|nr:hypothetical protein [Candidatus Nealsonbacteria bacterium]HEB46824.1 hypothetical protein [Candidatus Nealsonbacteria bacterium]
MPFITEGKTNLKYILIVVVLAVIVGGGILGYQYLSSKALAPEGWWSPKEEAKVPGVKPSVEIPGEVEVPEEKVPVDETANWKLYTDKKFGYTIKYPKGLIVEESLSGDLSDVNFYLPDYTETELQRGYGLSFLNTAFMPEELSSTFRGTVLNRLQLMGLKLISEKNVIIDNREGIYIATEIPGLTPLYIIYLPFPEFVPDSELYPGWEGALEIDLYYGLAEGERERHLEVVEKIYTSLKF